MCQPRMMRMTSTSAASSSLPRTCWRTIFTAVFKNDLQTKQALSIVRSFDGQIVQENKTQTNFRAGKCRRQMVERIRGANRGNRRAIERLFSGAEQTLRIVVGNAAVATNAEFQHHSSTVAKLRGLGHHGIPVASHAGQHALHVVAEVHAFGGRQNLISVAHAGLAAPALAITSRAGSPRNGSRISATSSGI